jgi:hypothetical protein
LRPGTATYAGRWAASTIRILMLKDLPDWCPAAAQGLAYWVGYRRAHYDGYHLPEAALVTEACSLIARHLPETLTLVPEYRYSDLLTSSQLVGPLTSRSRFDLLIHEATDGLARPRSAIEVKRAAASDNDINIDLRRLAILKQNISGLRCFLLVISESSRPGRFVTPGGGSKKGKHAIPGAPTAHYRVRRTLKAAPKFSEKSVAHFACVIEVYKGAA